MAIPIVCEHCGYFFLSNAIGGTARVSITRTTTSCPRCGALTAMDGEFQVAKEHTVVLSAPWLEDFESKIRQLQITRGQAKRIQRKIAKASNISGISGSVRHISPEIADAVEQVVRQPTSESDKWQWLYRIAAVVGIAAGINTFSSDYNIDTAINWIKSHRSNSASEPSPSIAQDKPMEETQKDNDDGAG